MEKNKRERLPWVDWAKGLCILLMCIGHSNAPEWIKTFIYTFHMPAFFIISGYLYKKHSTVRRLKNIAPPILSFGLINYIFQNMVAAIKTGGEITINSIWLFPTYFPGFWFIVTLLIIYAIVDRFSNRKFYFSFFLIAICCILFLELIEKLIVSCNVMICYMLNLITCYPFFYIGMLLKETNYNILSMKLSYCILLFLVIIPIAIIQGRSDLGELLFNYSYFLFFINALLVSLIFFKLCSMFQRNGFIEVISIGTLIILGIHRILISFSYAVVKYKEICWIISIMMISIFGYILIKLIKKHYPAFLGKGR